MRWKIYFIWHLGQVLHFHTNSRFLIHFCTNTVERQAVAINHVPHVWCWMINNRRKIGPSFVDVITLESEMSEKVFPLSFLFWREKLNKKKSEVERQAARRILQHVQSEIITFTIDFDSPTLIWLPLLRFSHSHIMSILKNSMMMREEEELRFSPVFLQTVIMSDCRHCRRSSD